MSARGQTVMVWWALITMYIYGYCLWGLLGMMPPPTPLLTAEAVAAFYTDNNSAIRLGAMITSWTSAFAVPLAVVIAVQISRLESPPKGQLPFWAILALVSGILMSIFLVLPPLFWGVAAFSPDRAPDATALMHELGTLTLTTTDQFYIWQMVAIFVISQKYKNNPLSPFPAWLGWFTLWAAIVFEVGALAFMFKKGPFAWNGLFVYWFPLTIYGTWITTMAVSLLKAIKRQAAAATVA